MTTNGDIKMKMDIIEVFRERIEEIKLLRHVQTHHPSERDEQKIASIIRKLNPKMPSKKIQELVKLYADMKYDVSKIPHNPNRLFDGQRPVVYQWFKHKNLEQFGWKQIKTIASRLHMKLSDVFVKAGY